MPGDDDPRGPPQGHGSPVIAQAGPLPEDVGRGGRSEVVHGREPRDEALPVGRSAGGLGLLGHRLGDEDRVGIGGAAEGEWPAPHLVPGEDRVANRRRDGRLCMGDGRPPGSLRSWHATQDIPERTDLDPRRAAARGHDVDTYHHPMRFGAAFWVNRTSWTDLRAACHLAERVGWDSIWIDDHLLADEGDPTDGKLEGWTTLAALAMLTSHVRLGLLVAANTFRPPGLTAKLATTLDQLSDGRAVLGIGAGWFGREHEAHGIDFGSGFGERLDRLDEAVGLIRRLLDGETVTHDGPAYRMDAAVCRPRPIQDRLPILIGGSGPNKTLRTVARYADIWNGLGSPGRIVEVSELLRRRCDELGRSFDAIERTVTLHVVIRDTRAEAESAWSAVALRHGLEGRIGADGVTRGLSVGGPPNDVAEFIDGYRRAGVGEVMLVFRDPFDLETIERVGQVRAALGSDPSVGDRPAPAF